MSNVILGNSIGGAAPLKTLIIKDENGVELTGVITGSEVIFTATDNDVREGSVYASENGISTGTKVIPPYHTSHGSKLVPKGQDVTLSLPYLNLYDYTVLHCIICSYNTDLSDSTSAEQVVFFDAVYNVQSTEVVAEVTKDVDNKRINFGFTNNTDNHIVLRYITYKEIE